MCFGKVPVFKQTDLKCCKYKYPANIIAWEIGKHEAKETQRILTQNYVADNFLFYLGFASQSYKTLLFAAQPGKLVLLLCNTPVTNKKQNPITFIQLEENRQFRTGTLCVYTKKNADIILSYVPKLSWNNPEAQKILYQLKNGEKNPNQTLEIFSISANFLFTKNGLKFYIIKEICFLQLQITLLWY